jgi:hypothetical protein
MRESG